MPLKQCEFLIPVVYSKKKGIKNHPRFSIPFCGPDGTTGIKSKYAAAYISYRYGVDFQYAITPFSFLS